MCLGLGIRTQHRHQIALKSLLNQVTGARVCRSYHPPALEFERSQLSGLRGWRWADLDGHDLPLARASRGQNEKPTGPHVRQLITFAICDPSVLNIDRTLRLICKTSPRRQGWGGGTLVFCVALVRIRGRLGVHRLLATVLIGTLFTTPARG